MLMQVKCVNVALKTRSPVMKTHLDVLPVHLVQKTRLFFKVVRQHKMLYVTRSVLVVTGKESGRKNSNNVCIFTW